MTSVKKEIIFDGEKYGYDLSYVNLKDLPFWYKRLRDLRKLGYESGRLLDIGCNFGFFLRVCEPYFETYGIDISRYAVDQARYYALRSKILLHDVERGLPFKEGTFDVVVMFDVLEHFKKYEDVLKEVHRVLRPSGCILLTTPNRWSLDSFFFGKDYWFKRDNTHVVLFSKDSLRRNLLKAGFRVKKIRTITFLHFFPLDFLKTISLPERTPQSSLPGKKCEKKWKDKIPTSAKVCLKKVYQLINDLPTPWGANLYAICKKQSKSCDTLIY